MLRRFATKVARLVFGTRRAALLYRLISESAWQYRWRYAAAIVLMIIVAGAAAGVALTIEVVTEQVFVERRPEFVVLIAVWIALIFIVRGLAMFGQVALLARVGNRIVAGLQERLYDHVLAQGIGFVSSQGPGELATRITHNANAARQALQLLATRLGVDLFSTLSLMAVMLYQDWRMALVAGLGLPPVFGGVALIVSRVKRLARAEVRMYSRILGAMAETISGARVIKAFGLEDAMRRRMMDAVGGARDKADRIALMRALVSPLTDTTAGLAAAAVVLLGGWRVMNHGLEVGSLLSFLTALLLVGDPARRLAQLNVQLRQHMAGVEFIFEVLDRRVVLTEREGAEPLALSAGEVRLQDVHFSYDAGASGEGAALNGMSFTAPGGEVTALVGPSGAGKSTVLALLERFYDVTAGAITIDGQDVRDVTLPSLRHAMALVTQETFLFDATAGENIGFGRADATRDEIEHAARQANAHDFIMELEQGYDTPLGEGGQRLSGGQRQRIAIARAMLRDSPILLLDEATSALDAETERVVQQALARLMRGRTTIVIAHRLATVRAADQICVVDGGRVVELGTHDRLVHQQGLYSRLAALQFGPTPDTGFERASA
ncbi:MAG TPA: ABC transporter ATP-binding protein [Paracoccaceae bacterium]|nr:ABC transporter ATP-binding protein [Paracoccaceae bacterium]